MAFILLDYMLSFVLAREDMDRMKILRSELDDIHSVLASIHKNDGTSASLGN